MNKQQTKNVKKVSPTLVNKKANYSKKKIVVDKNFEAIKAFFSRLLKKKKNIFKKLDSIGVVICITDGVAKVTGLRKVKAMELVNFPNNVKGAALNIETAWVGIINFSSDKYVKQNDRVTRSFSVIKIPVGENLKGNVIDSLGNSLTTTNFITASQEYYNLETKAPGIITRKSVHQPLQTGIIAIDSMVPIGLGQRELIIGDRQTGKTAVAIDAIINQKYQNNKVACVYVAIGQKRSTVAQLINRLKVEKALSYTVAVSATASDAAALQFLAPYAGCAVGE